MTIQLARYLPKKPFNEVLRRFHPKYWTVDYNALMVATIIPINERGFKIPGQWRTNSDFLGVRWESEDRYNHDYFKYSTDNNYSGTILAFRANPSEPDKFTVTITSYDVAYTYRLSPYVLNTETNRYEPLDPMYNTGRTYPADVIVPQAEWTEIPEREMTPFKTRSDYIFILDFDDIRLFSQYDGPTIPTTDLSRISFDTIEWSHGLGKDAVITSMVQDGDRVRMSIGSAVPGSVLSKGDKLTYLARFYVPEFTTVGNRPTTHWPDGPDSWGVSHPIRKTTINVSGVVWDGTAATVTFRGFATNGSWPFDQYDIAKCPVLDIQEIYPGVVEITYDATGTVLEYGRKHWALMYATLTYTQEVVRPRESQVEVDEWEGFGTGSLTVWYKGTLTGRFYQCDALYSRYLAVTSPAEVTDSTKYFVDMTVTGNRPDILVRNHPEPEHDLMMTSGFDDGYNLTPARQVDMVHALGYRGNWTTYIGMSHYFNGRTTWMDKVTGEIVAPPRKNSVTVLFAGQSNAAGYFIVGRYPDRGVEAFQRKAAELLGVDWTQIVCMNGATGSTAADRICAVNPNDENFDPDQTHGAGGLWWWDLEANKPGPAFDHCIDVVGFEKPDCVIWAQGGQDGHAIQFPGTTDPKPSVARTKAATVAIFAHMRALWGSDMPVIIQELEWGWSDANASLIPGSPMYLDATRNEWGDVVMTWLAYSDDPAQRTYRVDIFHPTYPDVVLRSYEVPGSNIINGLITFDWPVEENVPAAVEAFGDQFPWGFFRWQVTTIIADMDDPEVPPGEEPVPVPVLASPITDQTVVLDNRSFTKKICVLGINSLAGGYFNDLSDPLNPGGTGNPGRKDVVAASTFRRTFAQKAGLRDVEVMPVMTVVGSSPINPMPYQPGFPTDNYWWNPTTKQPGPNLIMANEIVQALGTYPDFFMESGPGESTGISFASNAQRPAILAAFRQSNIEMLEWMRTNWGNASLEIWFQGATTSFWGDPPPQETNAEGAGLLRDLQTSMSKEGIGFKMGSYVPDSNLYTTYRNEMAEGLGWIHYTVEGYHNAAREMGEAMALDYNRAYSPPDWTELKVPTNLTAKKETNGDITMTWDARPDAPGWYFINKRGDTQEVISEGPLTSNTYVFTKAAQQAVYGAEAHYMVFDVSEYIPVTQARGPATNFTGQVSGDTELVAPSNLKANKQLNGDIVFTWDAREGYNIFYIINRNVNGGPSISEGQNLGPSFTFTKARQIQVYGGEVNYVEFMVSEVSGSNVGPAAEWYGDAIQPINPFNPITGFEAHFVGAAGFSDIAMTWNASPTPGMTYRVVNRRVDNAVVISTTDTTDTATTFTTAQQTAAYGYTVGFIDILICEYDPVNDISGPVYNFNGAPTA